MTLSSDNIVQSNAAGAAVAGTSMPVSVSSGTTAGNTVVVGCVSTNSQAPTAPAGFVRVTGAFDAVAIYYKSNVAAAETSWTFTWGVSVPWSWWVMEVGGLDPDDPVDAFAIGSNASPQPSGTTATNSATDTMIVASWGVWTASGAAPTFSSQTNGFVELAEAASSTGGAESDIAVATLFPGDVGTFSSTATKTAAGAGSGGSIVVLVAANATRYAPIVAHTGFEFGTDAGLVTGPNGQKLMDIADGVIGTAVKVVAGIRTGGTGSYVLRIVAAGAVADAYWLSNNSIPTGRKGAMFGLWVRVVSATGTPKIAMLMDSSITHNLELVYDSSATKFGLRWTGGTAVWQPGTTALNTWVRVDMNFWGLGGATWHSEWWLDGVAQTAPTDLTGMTARTLWIARCGTDAAETFTAEYDDVRLAAQRTTTPLGDQKIVLLKVDPVATPTISGTAANFNTFNNNGTMVAWNATTARDALDEVPPTIGASADGVAQITAAASDYMEFPMDTYVLAANERIAGVRAILCGWAASATANTVGFRVYDGTTETVVFAVADPQFDNAVATWISYNWTQAAGRWTQAKLNAAALRLGWSTDATPDVGAHALYLEVVIATVASQQLFGDLATAVLDTDNKAVASVAVTAPAGADTSLYYETNTSPTTVPVTGGTSHTELVDAPDAPTTNYIAVYPPAEPVLDT